PWAATGILGVVWTFWHLPMFWVPGAAIPGFMGLSLVSVVVYLAQITAVAGVVTGFFGHTRGGGLLAILLHLTVNASRKLVFAGSPGMVAAQKREVYIVNTVLLGVVAALGLMLSGRRTRRGTCPAGHGRCFEVHGSPGPAGR